MTSPTAKSVRGEPAREPAASGGLGALLRKELADQLNSNRFFLLFALLAVASVAGFYGSINAITDSGEAGDFLYLTLLTTSGSSIPNFASFLGFLGPLMGIVLGFDAISRERSMGTLNRLAAQPIHRDAIINGKFLSGLLIICMTVFALGILVVAAGILATGLPPQGEEIARIFAFLLFTCVYISFWLALSILFSVLCRHAATSALAGIALWIFLSFFMSMVASAVAASLYPLDGLEGLLNIEKNYSLEMALNRISPYYLFAEASSTILSPSVRAVDALSALQLVSPTSGAVAGYLPFGQSLLLVWPQLVTMVALSAICFGASYIVFMRQEIRA